MEQLYINIQQILWLDTAEIGGKYSNGKKKYTALN